MEKGSEQKNSPDLSAEWAELLARGENLEAKKAKELLNQILNSKSTIEN